MDKNIDEKKGKQFRKIENNSPLNEEVGSIAETMAAFWRERPEIKKEEINSISFESNSDKSAYTLSEFEMLKKNNKVFNINYSQQVTRPKLYMIDSSLYTPVKDNSDGIIFRKVTDLEFNETYSNVQDFFIYCQADLGKKYPGVIESELESREIPNLSQQIQNIGTLSAKINTPNPEIIPLIQFRQQYEMITKSGTKVFKVPESNRPVSYPESNYNEYRVKFIKNGREQPYSNNYNFPIIKFSSEIGTDYYLVDKNPKTNKNYIRKIDKIKLIKDGFDITFAALLKPLPNDNEVNVITKKIDDSYYLYNLLQIFKQEKFMLIDSIEANNRSNIQRDMNLQLKSGKNQQQKFFDPQAMPFEMQDKPNVKQSSSQLSNSQKKIYNERNESNYFDPQAMPFETQNKANVEQPKFFDPQAMPFETTNELNYFDPQTMPFETAQPDNSKAKFNLKSNKEPANFHYFTFNRLINNGEIKPINISQKNKINDLSESLKNETDSLVLYQKNFGLYFHKPEKGERSSDFANKITDIEVIEKNDKSNKVLLHFASSEQKKENSAEINCSDDELNNLLSFIESQDMFDAEKSDTFPAFFGNMFYHSDTMPDSEKNEALFGEIDDTLFPAPFPDNTQYLNVPKSENKKSTDNETTEKTKPQNPQDADGNHSININAGPGGTVNFYPPHSKRNSNTDGGESTVSNVSGFNYSVIPDPIPMQNITTSDMERDGYFMADTGNMSKQAPAPAPIQTATETPPPSAPEKPPVKTEDKAPKEPKQKKEIPEIGTNPYSKGNVPNKPEKPQKGEKPKSDKQSGFESFITELLPFIGIGILAFLMIFGATMTLPLSTGLLVLGGSMFLYKEATVRGTKNVFMVPHKHMSRTYKNYATYRMAEKNRKLEAEMNLQKQFSSGKEIMEDLKAEDAEINAIKNKNLQKAFLTDEEKQDENLSEEERNTLAFVRYTEYMDKNHPLKFDNIKPKEVPNFKSTTIPGKVSPESARTFSSDPDLNPEENKNEKDTTPKKADSATSRIDIEGIHSGQGSLHDAEKPYEKPLKDLSEKKPSESTEKFGESKEKLGESKKKTGEQEHQK